MTTETEEIDQEWIKDRLSEPDNYPSQRKAVKKYHSSDQGRKATARASKRWRWKERHAMSICNPEFCIWCKEDYPMGSTEKPDENIGEETD